MNDDFPMEPIVSFYQEEREMLQWYSRLPKDCKTLDLIDDLAQSMYDAGLPRNRAITVACKWIKERVDTYQYETCIHPLEEERYKDEIEVAIHENAVHAIADEVAARTDIVLTERIGPKKRYQDKDDLMHPMPKPEDKEYPPHYHRRRFQMFFMKFPKKRG